MAKKGGGGGNGAGPSKHKVKKPVAKGKKNTQFKSLKKTETRQALVQVEKKSQKGEKQITVKKAPRIADEFRNFDERIKAAKRSDNNRKTIVAAPTFVVPAPTFQFKPTAPFVPQREVEGFEGFISAMQEPSIAPQSTSHRDSARRSKNQQLHSSSAPSGNVFSVLDDDDDTTAQPAPLPAPDFLRPATFSFQNNFKAPSGGLTSLQQSLLGQNAAFTVPVTASATGAPIDPDL